jgi:hypothetical protein
MKKFSDNGFEKEDIKWLRAEIVFCYAEILPQFDKALESLPRR